VPPERVATGTTSTTPGAPIEQDRELVAGEPGEVEEEHGHMSVVALRLGQGAAEVVHERGPGSAAR